MSDPAPSLSFATIDWSQPIELTDGTPLRLCRDDEVFGACNPDQDGNFWVCRVDGQPFFGFIDQLGCSPDGDCDDLGTICNRAAVATAVEG